MSQAQQPWYDPEQDLAKSNWSPQINQTSQPIRLTSAHKWQWNLIKWGLGIATAGIGLLTCLVLEHRWKNYFRAQQANLEQAAAQILAQQHKRHAVLVKMIDNTQGVIAYEKDLLTSITTLRAQQTNPSDVANVQKALNFAFENYPDLKASAQIRDLNDQIYLLEQQINAAITKYNHVASQFNQNLQVFPKNYSAQKLGLKTIRLFQPDPTTLSDVKINLNKG